MNYSCRGEQKEEQQVTTLFDQTEKKYINQRNAQIN